MDIPTPPACYYLHMTVGGHEETVPVGNDEAIAFSVALWIMQGYMKDGYQIYGNFKDMWVATRRGIPGEIVLKLYSFYSN